MAIVKIKAREFVDDVRSSSSKVTLRRKYGISETGLQRALNEMVDKGFLTLSDVDACQWHEPTTKETWICPACERPQGKVWEICPACGVIVSKFQPKPQIHIYEEPKQERPTSIGDFFRVVGTNFSLLRKDGLVWAILLFTMLPLILTIPKIDLGIALNSLLVAVIWAVVFKRIIVRDQGGWAAPISAMLFTAFIGIGLLAPSYCFMPQELKVLKESASSLVALSGWVVEVGVCEEICKALPAFFYIRWKSLRKEEIDPRSLVIIAVFSAVGFAATENVGYAFKVASQVSVIGS